MGYFPAKEIRPGLFIGSEGDSQSPAFMTAHDIALVVNCSRNITPISMPGLQHEKINVDDSTAYNDKMLARWPVVVREIDAVLGLGKGVLVHCRAGMQRSAATVAAYLMYKFGLSAKDAMRTIKERKPETFWPVATFKKALYAYELQLKANRSANGRSSSS